MKISRHVVIFILIGAIGSFLGLYLSKPDAALEKQTDREKVGVLEAVKQPHRTVDSVGERSEYREFLDVESAPEGAVRGERVLQFTNRDDYERFIEKLKALGLKQVRNVDELLAVSVPSRLLELLRPTDFGASIEFPYVVRRPLPPSLVDPVSFASLRPLEMSAREIASDFTDGSGEGVLVAVVDSGFTAHQDFEGIDVTEIDFIGIRDGTEIAEHGSSVASIITGSRGVASAADLLSIRVLDEQGLGSSFDVAAGIIEAVNRGADIINLSLGVYEDTDILRQAVDYAEGQGVLLVAAAGNDAIGQLPYPAAYDPVLAVTAVDAVQNQAAFSNQSDHIDFAAPGVGVETASGASSSMLFSGTSAATPFISGTLAALMSGPEALSAPAALDVIRDSLNDAGAPGDDPLYGAGVVDWERIGYRDTPDLIDAGLTGIHLSSDALPGTTMPVEVTVQNLGTQLLSDAELEALVVGEEVVRYPIGTLLPGQTTTRQIYVEIPSEHTEEVMRVAARVLVAEDSEDIRPENNLKAVQFRPR